MTETKLWRKNSLGIGTWRIWHDDARIYYAHSSTEGGAEIVHHEDVTINNSGRNLQQQIDLMIRSRISRMMDKGYKFSRAEAVKGDTNQLNLPNPMLAQPFEKVAIKSFQDAYVQRKYDGHRCLITKQGNEIIAYSRKGKVIDTIDHILRPLLDVMDDDMTLDGELYVHGQPLQTISSLVKRKQPDSSKLMYHLYDQISGSIFTERFAHLMDITKNFGYDHPVKLVSTIPVHNMSDVWQLFTLFKGEGYEGAMLRQSIRRYEANKRSDQLIKIKSRQDTEFQVVDIKPGKNDIGILVLKLTDNKTFDCTAPGTMVEKVWTYHNRSKFIGKYVTVEYANMTNDGVPFHCVATRWREDV